MGASTSKNSSRLELIVEPWLEKLFNEEIAQRFDSSSAGFLLIVLFSFDLSSEQLAAAFSAKVSIAASKDKDEKEKLLQEWKVEKKITVISWISLSCFLMREFLIHRLNRLLVRLRVMVRTLLRCPELAHPGRLSCQSWSTPTHRGTL